MPAAKKDPSVRRRRNTASTASTLHTPTAAEARKRTPALPKLIDPMTEGPVEWHAAVRAWWRDVWASPMSGQWHSSDEHGLIVLALLMQDFHTARSASARKEAATEIRLQRQSFGLTPYDRRRLEWTIATAEDATERGARRGRRTTEDKPAAEKTDPTEDPRLVLVQ